MSEQPDRDQAAAPRSVLGAFPKPGPLVEHAYRELDQAMSGSAAQVQALGDLAERPRPWDPTSCRDRALRAELWAWLDQVTTWLNREYVWAADTIVPGCWPLHRHLVAEIAVLADLRRRAGLAMTGDAMEEWHRYALPAFYDRMRQRLGPGGCASSHDPWPAGGAYKRHLSRLAVDERAATFAADVEAMPVPVQAASAPTGFTHRAQPWADGPGLTPQSQPPAAHPRFQLIDGLKVDSDTGELFD